MKAVRDFAEDQAGSLALIDPWRSLAVGVCLQAARDLQGRDLVRRIDALLWMADRTSSAPAFFDAVGLGDDPLALLRRGYAKNKKRAGTPARERVKE